MKRLPFWMSTAAMVAAALVGASLGAVSVVDSEPVPEHYKPAAFGVVERMLGIVITTESRLTPEQNIACWGVVQGLSDLSELRDDYGLIITLNARPELVARSDQLVLQIRADEARASPAYHERREALLEAGVLDEIRQEHYRAPEQKLLEYTAECERLLAWD